MSLTPEQQDEIQLKQIKQRRSPYQPKHIGKAMRQLFAQTGLGQTQAAQDLDQAWSEIAGPKLASTTQPGKITRGVLSILVQDSSSLQELEFGKRQFLAKLQTALPHAGIKSIRGRLA